MHTVHNDLTVTLTKITTMTTTTTNNDTESHSTYASLTEITATSTISPRISSHSSSSSSSKKRKKKRILSVVVIISLVIFFLVLSSTFISVSNIRSSKIYVRKVQETISGENNAEKVDLQRQQYNTSLAITTITSTNTTKKTSSLTPPKPRETTLLRESKHHDPKQQQQQRRRYFGTHPVTNEEHERLTHIESRFSYTTTNTNTTKSTTTFAVCHPTLFGNVSISRILSFVSYYRLLGFGHIFLWIDRSSVTWTSTQYQQLEDLMYVTLTDYVTSPNNTSMTNHESSSEKMGNDKSYHGQTTVQYLCRSHPDYAANYDWNLVVDADEYLWLGHNHQTIQGFMDRYNKNNQYTYISFGKWQYSPVNILSSINDAHNEYDNSSIDTVVNHFGIERYAFTPKLYCYNDVNNDANHHQHYKWQDTMTSRQANDYCPDWPGRCKILSKPSKHVRLGVHGYDDGLKSPDGIHWNHQTAHIKEWPGIAVLDTDIDDADPLTVKQRHVGVETEVTVFVRTCKRFSTTNNTELLVHSLHQAFRRLPNGSIPVFYDAHLSSWMDFVASRTPVVLDEGNKSPYIKENRTL
jgi:Glycosyltransferase family 92